jgi:hypothetical protein
MTIDGGITIRAGSSGYNNLSDKPDLGVYETKAEFNVFATQISGTVTAQGTTINSLGQSITNIWAAGFLTEATGNTIWARRDGIISAINQTPESVTIMASRINLAGAVTFSMLNDAVFNEIYNKLTSGNVNFTDLSATLRTQINTMSTDIANKVSPSALKAFALSVNAGPTKADLAAALQTEITNKLTGSATAGVIGGVSKLADIMVNGYSLVVGGYIQAQYINVDALTVNNALKVGVFTANDYHLIGVSGTSNADITPFGMIVKGNYYEAGINLEYIYVKRNTTLSTTYSYNFQLSHLPGTGISERNAGIGLLKGSGSDWYLSTILQLSHMPALDTLNAHSTVANSIGTGNYAVRWDARTGCLYIG